MVAAFASLDGTLQAAWGYDAAAQKYQLYDPLGRELSDLVNVVPGRGYWLRLSTPGILRHQGRDMPLVAGWNLIGWL